jgi:hypothetical protein
MTKGFSPKQAFAVRCPTCGAAPGEKCELTSGQPRTDPHRERRVTAKLRPIERRKVKVKEIESVASILERQLGPSIAEWLRQVNLAPDLANIALSDADRTGHLPELFKDLIARLRHDRDVTQPFSLAAAAHGGVRFGQGYSLAMLVEESRIFQISTFGTLRLHRRKLDPEQVMLDVITIADEADRQLAQSVRSFVAAQQATA